MAGFLLKVCGGVGEKRYDIRSDRRRLRRKEAIKKEGKRLRAAASLPSLPRRIPLMQYYERGSSAKSVDCRFCCCSERSKKIRPPLREIFEGREEESGRPKTRIVVAAEKEREEGLEIDRSPTAAARQSSEGGRKEDYIPLGK